VSRKTRNSSEHCSEFNPFFSHYNKNKEKTKIWLCFDVKRCARGLEAKKMKKKEVEGEKGESPAGGLL
jgi:hypothetical protein